MDIPLGDCARSRGTGGPCAKPSRACSAARVARKVVPGDYRCPTPSVASEQSQDSLFLDVNTGSERLMGIWKAYWTPAGICGPGQ